MSVGETGAGATARPSHETARSDGKLGSALLLGGLALGLWLRIDGFGASALFGDEFHTLDLARKNLREIVTTFDDVGSHVVLPFLQHVALAVFGDGAFSLRLPALIPGILTLLVIFPVARSFAGRTPAILATLAFAISPMHVYYARFGRSYALLALLELLLAFYVIRSSTAQQRGARGPWIAVFTLGVLAPYTHLASAGFVAGIGLVALVLAWRERGSATSLRALTPPIVAFGAAAVLCGLLYLPLVAQIKTYIETTAGIKEHPSTWFGIPLLLAGGEASGWVWLVAFPAGLLVLARKRFDVALVCFVSLVGPLVMLLVQMPHGMEFAYARYLMGAVPFIAIAIAAGWCVLVRRFVRDPANGERIALIGGTLLIAASYLGGPFAGAAPKTGAFDNTYLAMRKLPAFDRAWPGAPDIYDEIAALEGDVRVVEAAPISSRAVLLYRSHALRHGKRVSLGWPEEYAGAMHEALFVNLSTVSKDEADYVIIHRNLPREVRAYWRFVYDEVWSTIENDADAGFMERHRAHFIAGQEQTSEQFGAVLAAIVRAHLGPATYKQKHVLVWKL